MRVKKKTSFVRQIEGDLYTPIAIYQMITGRKKFLLESSLKHQQQGRYSFIGSNPHLELIADGNQVIIQKEDGVSEVVKGKFLDVLADYLPEVNEDDFLFPLMGGAIGYIGYDIIRQYEYIGPELQDELDMPEAHVMFYRDVIVYDHFKQKISIVSLGHDDDEISFNQRAEHVIYSIEKDSMFIQSKNMLHPVRFKENTTEAQFKQKVVKAKEEILKGEIFQVVLSQRFTSSFSGDPFYFYRSLRRHNPSPYMFYLDFEKYQIVGSSPESLLKGDGKKVITNPIAGTRKRGMTTEEDEQLELDLLQDEKELAEHRMLVDLGRNDLGRVCEIGTIELTKYMNVEKYKHVMHIVSEVCGEKRTDFTNGDVLAACLPAGTVSGAPKIRAMYIINELEDMKRNVYGGAVGYFSNHGSFDFALAIRTMIVKDGVATIQSGAGIVYDSNPEAEYQEVLNKARAFMEVEL